MVGATMRHVGVRCCAAAAATEKRWKVSASTLGDENVSVKFLLRITKVVKSSGQYVWSKVVKFTPRIKNRLPDYACPSSSGRI